MRYIPEIHLIDRRKSNFSRHYTEVVIISFKSKNRQGPFLMIQRVYYCEDIVEYAEIIWSTHHIIPAIKKFISKELPGLARIIKLPKYKQPIIMGDLPF